MSWYEDKIKKHPAYTSGGLTPAVDILYPSFAFLALQLVALARNEGLSVFIYEMYRSQERQAELFKKGVTKLKTNGMHHFGIAADIVFLDAKGNPSWAGTHNWARLGQIGQTLGLEWGGSWQGFADLAHFQLVPATTSAQAKIIMGQYPAYLPEIDQRIGNLLALYEVARTSNFTNPALTALLDFFKAPPPTPTPVAPAAPLFIRDLAKNATGADVTLLQKLLNTDPATRIALSGAGSPGHETDRFGDLTEKAVQKFQVKYGVAFPGSGGYGLVGPRTRTKLQEVFGGK